MRLLRLLLLLNALLALLLLDLLALQPVATLFDPVGQAAGRCRQQQKRDVRHAGDNPHNAENGSGDSQRLG